MKTIITILTIVTFSITSVLANTTPVTLYSSEDMDIVNVEGAAFFSNAAYDQESENLLFTTNDEISIIQIFDAEGNMTFQLPVMSNQVQINKNLFDEGAGQYKLGFILEGQSQLHFTQVTIK